QDLLQLSSTLMEHCGRFFEPVVLAQLDAALAHEFAQQERGRVDAATEAVNAAISEGRTAEALAHLNQRVATARGIATKSESQAALATEVLTALGGQAGGKGFDPEVG